jgi:HSP20 family protein
MSSLNTVSPSRVQSSNTAEADGADLGRTFKPVYTIAETPDAFNATVYLPGVAKEGLEITAQEGEVRILGRRTWQQPEGWTAFHRESVDASFKLVLTHDNAIDPEKITAELSDGVLQLSLAKPEAVKPRKIAVK